MNTSGISRTVLFNNAGTVTNHTTDNLRYDNNLGQVTITDATLENNGDYTITVSYKTTSSSESGRDTVKVTVCGKLSNMHYDITTLY